MAERVVETDDEGAEHSITKLPLCTAVAAISVPMIASAPPVMNPARRPKRPMASDAGTVIVAAPTMYVVTGSVAHNGLGASASPARPLTVIRVTE